MKMLRPYLAIYLFFFLMMGCIHTSAQENYIKISGQYRVRPEFRKGYKTLAADTAKAAFFISQRARLAFELKQGNIRFYSSIQDIRTWGDEEQLKDIPGLSVNELWLELGLKKGFSLKMGRQELVYDDQRLLGNLDWANATRSHDALLLKYINAEKKINWHLGGAFNQNGEPFFGTDYAVKNYKFLAFTWFKKQFAKSTLAATMIVNGLNAIQPSAKKTFTSYTFGPLYNFQDNHFKALLGGYYQAGKTETGLLLDAAMLNTYIEVRNGKMFSGAGFDYISGNSDNTANTQSHNFSTLYATNHKFYGYMDYFTNIPVDTKQRGLMDPYVRIGFTPNKTMTATVDVHHFLLAHKNNLLAKSIKKDLGSEVDLLFDFKINPLITLTSGYSMMFATNNMNLLKGGNKNNYNGWAFIMLKVTPTYTQDFKK